MIPVLLLDIFLIPEATILRASMSKPESVSSKIAIAGSSNAIWSKISGQVG